MKKDEDLRFGDCDLVRIEFFKIGRWSQKSGDTGDRQEIERPRVGRPKRMIAALRFGSEQPRVSGAGERPARQEWFIRYDAIIYRKGVWRIEQ
jgi:hypothetical protein